MLEGIQFSPDQDCFDIYQFDIQINESATHLIALTRIFLAANSSAEHLVNMSSAAFVKQYSELFANCQQSFG